MSNKARVTISRVTEAALGAGGRGTALNLSRAETTVASVPPPADEPKTMHNQSLLVMLYNLQFISKVDIRGPFYHVFNRFKR